MVAQQWLSCAPTIKIPNVTLEGLQSRKKNAKVVRDQAHLRVAEMASDPAYTCSTQFVDTQGKTLICYFAHRFSAEAASPEAQVCSLLSFFF